jgi:hypothetical protein
MPDQQGFATRMAHPVKVEALATVSKLFESDAQRFARNFDDAKAYHRRARLFAEQGQRASLVFNVASIAIECYLIALCARFKAMPMNHNFGCLVEDAEFFIDFPPGLANGIRSLDEIFGICSLDDYYHGTPEEKDAIKSLALCEGIHNLIVSIDPKTPAKHALPGTGNEVKA